MLLRLLALPLLFAVPAWACLNTPGTNLDGSPAGSRYDSELRDLRMRMQMPVELLRPDSAPSPPTPAKRLEADALELVYAGNYAAARPLLQQAEDATPGDYSIAANLGTVCELVGDNAEALKWITTAMRRNPDSHRGTEWVHVLILQAKLRDAATPASASRAPLIDVPARLKSDTAISVDGIKRPATEVREAILYQLHERMVFVKPRDPYVADLLLALSRLDANLVNIEAASGILTLAEEYGYANAARADALREDIAHARAKANGLDVTHWVVGLAALAGFLVIAYRRKWIFFTRSAYEAHRAATRLRIIRHDGEPVTADKPNPQVKTCER